MNVLRQVLIATVCVFFACVVFFELRNRQDPDTAVVPQNTVRANPDLGLASAAIDIGPTGNAGYGLPAGRQLSLVGRFPSLRLTPRRNLITTPPPALSQVQPHQEGLLVIPDRLQFSETLFTVNSPPQSAAEGKALSNHEHLPAKELDAGSNEAAEPKPPGLTLAFGAGLDRLPRWQGARENEVRRVPYLDINWRDQIELSTLKGLVVDILHDEKWHGGLVGTLIWGRSTRDLNGLPIATRQNTLQGGLFLEYAVTQTASLGVRYRQDLQNTGVSYGEIYAEWELPKLAYLEHNIRLSQESMNRTGMRRFFGLSTKDASLLGVPSYQPKAGLSKTSITYEGFQPLSESTGIVFGAMVSRLNAEASNSPLVRNFGSPMQKELFAALLYHF